VATSANASVVAQCPACSGLYWTVKGTAMARHSELELHYHHRSLIAATTALNGKTHSPVDTRKILALQNCRCSTLLCCTQLQQCTAGSSNFAAPYAVQTARGTHSTEAKLHPGMLSHRVPTAQPNNAMRTLILSGWTSTASVTGFEPLRTSSLQLSTKPGQQLQLQLSSRGLCTHTHAYMCQPQAEKA
jgi:hypothetical protein